MISSYLVLVLAGLATLDAALIRTSRAACPEVKTKADFDYRPVYISSGSHSGNALSFDSFNSTPVFGTKLSASPTCSRKVQHANGPFTKK